MQVTITNGGRTDTFDIIDINNLSLVPKAAIYTIWTFDPVSQNYPLLYVGESGNLESRLDESHHKYQSWLDNMKTGLYAGYWLVPTSQYTKEQRFDLESSLIRAHSPICNG